MTLRSAIAGAVLTILNPAISFALDARNPDPISVLHAMFATRNVGNIEAALAFYSDEGYLILTGGKTYNGKEELRGLFTMFVRENVQADVAPDAVVKGNTVISHSDVSTGWMHKFGIPSVKAVGISVVDGTKIKSDIWYYPFASLAKFAEGCARMPEVAMPNRPCGEVIPLLRAHTESLIAQGIAEKE